MSEEPRRAGTAGRVTLNDLSAHAGVSRSTVSLVMGNSPLVAATTRARVLESARLLGYVYNRAAAQLRTRRTHTIGVAINEITNPYFTELTAAIQRAFRHLGRAVFVSNSDEDPALQDQFIGAMREHRADGLVLCPAAGTDPATLMRLRDLGMPCVLMSRDLAGTALDYVGHANQRGCALATAHLLDLGHERIAMVGGVEEVSTARERQAGYRQALAARGIPADPTLVAAGPPSRGFGFAAIHRLLDIADPPTAAICFNDVIAFGAMLGLRQRGIEPGRDFAVVGYDDLAEAALWTPALTTVRIDTAALGTAAAELLLTRIEAPDGPARRVITEAELVVRASSCPRPARHGPGRRSVP